jgi:hypothetical protein
MFSKKRNFVLYFTDLTLFHVRALLLLFILFLASIAASAQGSLYTFNGGGTSGNWNVASTWTTDPTGSTSVGARVPANGDNVFITNSFVALLTANVANTSLTITVQRGGTLDLGTFTFTNTLTRLAGQGTLRVNAAYFPVVTTNDFDDPNTGTVEYYNWTTTPGTLPRPASAQYNNLRLLNTTNTGYEARLDGNLTVNGTLNLARSGTGGVTLNFGSSTSTGRTLSVTGDVTVGTGTTVGVTAGVTGAHTWNVTGSLINNGTINLHNNNGVNDDERVLLNFTGTTDTNFACNGPTDLSRLQVSKGSGSRAILNVTATAAALPGNLRLNYFGGADLIILSGGTLKLGANINLPRLSNSGTGTNYEIGTPSSSPGLWIAGATVSNNLQLSLVVYGTFRISAGTFTSMGSEGAVLREEGQYIIEGGTTTVTKLRPSNTSVTTHRGSFSISGGVFEASGTTSDADYARFSLPYTTQSFRMTGGTIRAINVQSNGYGFHIGCRVDNAVVTGGTVELVCPASNTNFRLLSTAPLWDLSITKAGSGTSMLQLNSIGVGAPYASGATTAAQPLVVQHNLTLSGPNTPTLDANSQNVTVQGDFTIGAGTTYLPTANTTFFTGTNNQLFTNNGTISSTLYNLTMDKSAGTLQLNGAATTFTVSNVLSLLNGVLFDGGKILSVFGNVVNSASHTSGGGTGSITLSGTGSQTLGGNGFGVFGNLKLNSTAATGAVGATLIAEQTVASTLTLSSNNVLDIGIYRLSLTDISTTALVAGAGGFGTNRMIRTAGNQSDGGLRKTYGGINGFVFAVGTAGKYTPATITLNSAPPAYGRVSVSPAAVRDPFVTGPNALNYYWKVRSVDFGTIAAGGVTMEFTMLNTDAVGTLTSYVPGRYTPTTWTSTGNVAQVVEGATTSVIQFPSVAYLDGEYTAGEITVFGPVTAYYSIRSGNWEDTNPATTPWSTVSHTGTAATTTPGPGNPVFIGNAATSLTHVVTVTANGATSGSLQVDLGATLDVQTLTGHNFGSLPDAVVGGAGRLRISSATGTAQFPGGDFGGFLSAVGGTVEYYTTGTQDFTIPLTSFTGQSLGTYRNLWLNAGSSRTLTLPARDLRIYNRLRTGQQAGFTGLVILNASTNGNLTVDSLVSVERGTFRYPNGTLRSIVANNGVQVNSGATFDANGGGTAVANTLRVTNSLVNNGTVDFNNTGKTVALTFVGTANASLTGTSGTAATTLATMTVDKGSSQAPVLTLDVAGTLTTLTNSWLTLTHGTLRYAKPSSTLTIHDAASSYTIPDAASLMVDASTATVTVATANDATADLLLGGRLQVLQGTLNVGDPSLTATTANNDIEYASAGRPAIVVTTGTLRVNGQVRRSNSNNLGSLSYDQSGGLTDIYGLGATGTGNQRGVFEVLNTGSIFRMSGGTLGLHRSNGNSAVIADLYLAPDSTNVTGGVVALGTAASTLGNANVTVDSVVPLYDLRVEPGTTGNVNTGQLVADALTLKGSLTISNDFAVFNANGLGLNIAQQLINSNSSISTALNGGGFRPNVATQTTTFTGGVENQQLTAAGSTAANLTVFGNLTLNNAQTGGNLTLQAGRSARVAGTLTLTNGTLADNGQTINALGDVLNSATHTSATGGSLILSGTANQNIGGNGTGKFGNLTLNNSLGATAIANEEVTGVLTLTSGVFTIGSQLLYISNTSAAAIVGATSARFIRTNGIVADLGLRKAYPSGPSDFTFPMGVGTKYTPARLNVTANGAAGTLTVRPVNAPHPSTTDVANNTELLYYWKVTSTGFSSPTVTHTYSYAVADVQGTEASYVTGRFLSTAWVPVNGIAGTVSTAAHTLTLTGVSYFDGDYTGGYPAEFGTVPAYYSRTATAGTTVGGTDWNLASSWTFNADGSDSAILPSTFPTTANPTTILAGHQINANGSSRGTAQLVLNGTLDLAAGAANNFNTVTGTGTLKIGSALFPAGNYAAFVASTGGTVDYTAAVQLPARDTYNNLTFSGSNSKTLSNIDLTLNGQLTVNAGTSVNDITNQNLTLVSPTLGMVNNGTFVLNDGNLSIAANLTNTGTLMLGRGSVSTGTTLSNTGMLVANTGPITVGSSLTNGTGGTFTAADALIAVGSSLTNTGTFTGSSADLTVGTTFTNGTGGSFAAGGGFITVGTDVVNQGSYSASNNTLRVNGNYINSGAFTAGSSTLDIYSNFTNTGTFTAGTGLVRFLAGTASTVNGTTTFYDLQKLGSGARTITADITVSNLLTLQNGYFITNANTIFLTNTTTQPIIGTSSVAYVQGRLAISFPNAASTGREFPVGANGQYRPVTIRQEAASTSPVVMVEVIPVRPTGTIDPALSNISRSRYYRIFLVSGTINSPTVQLSFNTEGLVDEIVNVPGNLRIARSTTATGPWTNEGGAGVYSPGYPRGYAVSGLTSLTSNSLFTLASTNSVDNPLPVELTRFTATARETSVQLAWTTASEKNSAYFEVERSADGRGFAAIGRVAAAGTSTAPLSYTVTDAQPLPGLSYYRLHLVDQDATFSYSPVVAVRFTGKAAAPTVVAYPNPSKGTGFRLAATNLPAGPATVLIVNMYGQRISQQSVTFSQADVAVPLAQPLATGLYLVTVQTSAGSFTQKLVVE